MMPSPGGILIRIALSLAIALIFLLPLWWVAASAFRPEQAIFQYLSPLSLWTLIPLHPTLEHMIELLSGSFARAIFNSILVTALTVVFGLYVCATAAFALAVIEFPGRNVVFAVMIVSFLIPFDAIAVPLYSVMRDLQFQNSYAGLVLPGIGNGLAVFLLRQFFLALPRDLLEAAMLDGLGWFGIFWRIYVPLSRPALISAAIILFVFQWQAYLWPLLIAPDPSYKVAAVAIAEFSSSYDVSYGLIFAGALVLSVIPDGRAGVLPALFHLLGRLDGRQGVAAALSGEGAGCMTEFPIIEGAERLRLLTAPKGKVRAVLDTDTYNEIDDQFALVQMLLSPERISVEAIYAAPFHNARSSGPGDGMEKSHAEILTLLDRLGMDAGAKVFRGVDAWVGPEKAARSAPAVDDLIARARESTPEDPLYVCGDRGDQQRSLCAAARAGDHRPDRSRLAWRPCAALAGYG